MKKRHFSYKYKAVTLFIFLCFSLTRLSAQQYVYWTEYTYGTNNTKIASIKDDGSGYFSIVINDNTFPQGLGIYSNSLYWNELLPSAAKINQATFSPTNIQQVMGNLSAVRSIAIDNTNGKIYWTTSLANGNKISRADINGTNAVDLISFSPGNTNLRQIAIDVPGNKMYWADFGAGVIGKANLDGTSPSNLYTGETGNGYTGVTLDLANQRIYWTEINQNQINSIKTDGTDLKAGLTGLDRPQYITYDNGKLYWSQAGNFTQCIKSANVDAAGNITGVTTLHSAVNPGGITVGSTSSLLPVELILFTANSVKGNIELKWQTATEVDNYGFEIERSTTPDFVTPSLSKEGAGGGWDKIGFVPGAGNSNSPKEYSFIDENPPAGDLQYRLKQIDINGNSKYYSVIAKINFKPIDLEENQLPKEYALKQNYPNPFNPVTIISYQSPAAANVVLKIYNMLGNEVTTLVDEFKQPGYYQVSFNASGLSSGVYFYKLTVGSFTATKKLILMK